MFFKLEGCRRLAGEVWHACLDFPSQLDNQQLKGCDLSGKGKILVCSRRLEWTQRISTQDDFPAEFDGPEGLRP
jgi:hypothetical protein